MLFKKDLEAKKDGDYVETIGLIKAYEVKPTKNGGKFISGSIELKGSVDFKVWAGAVFDEMDKFDYRDMICRIQGKINEYSGNKSIVLSDIKALEEGTYEKSDFFEDKYNIEAYWNAFCKTVTQQCSDDGVNIFNKVINSVRDRFMIEFAARSHHDAVKGGLLAHTYKVTYLGSRVFGVYEGIAKNVDKDLFILGCALHDVGKICEYTNGTIQGNGLLVSHKTFGIELLMPFKEYIVELKGEEFFYRLLAIVQQHEGQYGEPVRTVEAFMVHMVDNMEAKFQKINENFEKGVEVMNVDEFILR